MSETNNSASTAKRSSHPLWIDRNNNALWLVGALWLECVIIWMIWYWSSFADLGFRDPDDAMRLVQVRDFLAGQSWFDVSQHRVNPPVGGPMHWSRLVDLPIAVLIIVLRPIAGQPLAETIACITVPILTFAIICFGLFASLRSFLGNGRALLSIALLVTSLPILTQVAPLRIDHHGWQIAMAVGLLGGLLHPNPHKGGWIMGLAMALWMHISSEGLPYAALAGAVLALRYTVRSGEWPRLIHYASVMAGVSALLLITTHGWSASFTSYCDAMSPVYLLPLLLLPPSLWLGQRIAGTCTVARRFAPPLIAGGTSVALFLAIGSPCLAGPFRTLDPVVYDFWYKGVLEGLPIWAQKPSMMAISLVPSLVGLVGLVLASWKETDPDRRFQWLSILGMALGSLLVSIAVLRAMSVAHLFALIGSMWIIATLYPAIAAQRLMVTRVVLTSMLALLSPVGLALAAASITSLAANEQEPLTAGKQDSCLAPEQIQALSRLPATILFAPIDLGPDILLRTQHMVIGTAHHRNVVGLGKVIHAFLDTPDNARTVIFSTQASYLLTCPDFNETRRYERIAPNGLMAQIIKGYPPQWLAPMNLPGLSALHLYRIDRTPVTPQRMTTPRH